MEYMKTRGVHERYCREKDEEESTYALHTLYSTCVSVGGQLNNFCCTAKQRVHITVIQNRTKLYYRNCC